MVKWKEISPLDDLSIGGCKFRNVIHDLTNCVLDFSIMFVTAVAVLQSKTVRLLANFLVIVFVWCCFGIRIVKRNCMNKPLPSRLVTWLFITRMNSWHKLNLKDSNNHCNGATQNQKKFLANNLASQKQIGSTT